MRRSLAGRTVKKPIGTLAEAFQISFGGGLIHIDIATTLTAATIVTSVPQRNLIAMLPCGRARRDDAPACRAAGFHLPRDGCGRAATGRARRRREIGRAHVCTPVTKAHIL